MFQFVIIVCRYLFVFCILLFLWEGLVYLLNEREIKNWNSLLAVTHQRGIIIIMHLVGFLLLSYEQGKLIFNLEVLIIAGIGLIFIISAQILVSLTYKNSCPLMWNGIFFLLDLSLIILQLLDPNGVKRQVVFISIGFTAMLIIPLVFKIINKLENFTKLYLALSFILLILPFFFGDRKYGSLNWITIGMISFQPSEIVKFLYVFYLASALHKNPNFQGLFTPTLVSAALVLILVLQNDLGGGLIFFITYMIMAYIATGRKLLVLSGLGAASIVAFAASHVITHVQTRVSVWLNPWADPYTKGYQIIQSLFAVASGGLWGTGLTRGSPGFIPAVNNDFIFAAICEEFGGLFGIGLFGIYIMIFYRGVHISLRCKKTYHSLLAAGYTSMLALQTFLIIGGVIKFIPMTGVTLPFVSLGGSSIVASILMIGILQRIHKENQDAEIDA